MLFRGRQFLQKLDEARGKIIKLASQFITNGAVSFNFKIHFLCSAFYVLDNIGSL